MFGLHGSRMFLLFLLLLMLWEHFIIFLTFITFLSVTSCRMCIYEHMKSWFCNTNLIYYLIFGRSPCVYPRFSHFANFSFDIFFLLYISKPAWASRLRTRRPCASEDVAAIRETGLKSGNDGARETQEMSEGEDRNNQDVDEMYSGRKEDRRRSSNMSLRW